MMMVLLEGQWEKEYKLEISKSLESERIVLKVMQAVK